MYGKNLVKNQTKIFKKSRNLRNLSKIRNYEKELFKKILMLMKMPIYYKFNFAKIEKKTTKGSKYNSAWCVISSKTIFVLNAIFQWKLAYFAL